MLLPTYSSLHPSILKDRNFFHLKTSSQELGHGDEKVEDDVADLVLAIEGVAHREQIIPAKAGVNLASAFDICIKKGSPDGTAFRVCKRRETVAEIFASGMRLARHVGANQFAVGGGMSASVGPSLRFIEGAIGERIANPTSREE